MSGGFMYGMTVHGILVHSPGRDGHLRIVGTDPKALAQRMLQHWEQDTELAILSPHNSLLFVDPAVYEQHTITCDLPAAAGLMRGLLAEMDWRLAHPKAGVPVPGADIIVVLEDADKLLSPADGARGQDGSSHELDRQSALFIRAGIRRILTEGVAAGFSVFATSTDADAGDWPNTSTVHLSPDGPTLELDGIHVSFTLT